MKPKDCDNCKKSTTYIYKRIARDENITYEMCKECSYLENIYGSEITTSTSLHTCCPTCHWTLDQLLETRNLGCPNCYFLFEKDILHLLDTTGNLEKQSSERATLHMGKTPSINHSMNLSEKISSLHLALDDALKKEKYELAAEIRDEINTLKGKENF